MGTTSDTIVHEWFERVWNQGEVAAIDELLSADAVVHGLVDASGAEMRGPDGFKPLHMAFRSAFPDMRIDVEDCVVEGERFAFRCVVRGTHQGDGLGVAATGRPVEFVGMGFIVVRDRQIVEAWNTFDFQAMNAQLGIQPGV
jgi:steroid delta-isomerase-like uncharacterized protein